MNREHQGKRSGTVWLPQPYSRFAGFGLLQCWVLPLFSSYVPFGASVSTLPVATYGINSLALACFALVVLASASRIAPLSSRTALISVAALAGSLGTVLVSGAVLSLAPPWFGIVGVVLSAGCTAWLQLAWQELFSTQGARAAICGYAVASLLGAVLYGILSMLAREIGLAVFVALPLLSGWWLCWARAGADSPAANAASQRAMPLRDLVSGWPCRALAIVVALALVCGLLCARGVQAQRDFGLSLWMGAACGTTAASFVACVVVARMADRTISRAFNLALPLSAAGVVALALGAPWSVDCAALFGTCGFFLAIYLVWMSFLERAYELKAPVLGYLAALCAASYGGMFAGQILSSWWPWSAEFLNYSALVLLLLAALVLGTLRDNLAVSPEAMEPVKAPSMEVVAAEIAKRSNLSPRETEILGIWLEGHNAGYIEERLCISRNTVKTHLRHIYQKVGVESKEEILALADRSHEAADK